MPVSKTPPPSAELGKPIFRRDGECFVPTELARGPWYPGTQHGSAMLGLLAHAIESHPAPYPAQVTRFTADLLRAAPMAPITTPTRIIKTGNSMEVVEATLEADGEVFARASAMRFRIAEIDTRDDTPRYGSGHFELPDAHPAMARSLDTEGEEAFHFAVEFRPALGVEEPVVWLRMKAPLVDDEPLTPFIRTALSSDWTYSVPFMHKIFSGGADVDPARSFSSINPDTSINLHRPMRGEWLCLDAHIHYGNQGAGTAMAYLQDQDGPIGHTSQCILVRPPHKLPDRMANSDAEERS
jgi:hypothetical protein